MKIEWKCPKCGAIPNEHGKGGSAKCQSPHQACCEGFLCDCGEPGDDPEHGDTLANPCPEAYCHHCGWGGSFPVKPKGLLAWEKNAIEAGWAMPDARAKELGMPPSSEDTEKKR